MKSLMRLGAFLLISSYAAVLFVPAIALAQAKPFPTCSITLTPSVISPGGATTIRWQSTNADGGAITNVGNVSANGAKEILPPSAQITTYVGSFTGPGGTANCTASVQVSYGTVTGSNTDVVNPNPTPVISSSGGGLTSGDASQPALVQCGIGSDIVGATGCQACNLAQLISSIINFAIGLSIPIAAALFAWAGILYFSSGASPGNIERAKGIFSNALIGFLIAITAWLVINTLLHALLDNGKAGFVGGNWFTVQCDSSARPVSGNINTVINSVLPGVNTAPLLSTSGSSYVCTEGVLNNGACRDPDGNAVGSPVLSNSSTNLGLGCSQYGPVSYIAGGQCYDDAEQLLGPALRAGALTDSQQDALQDACDDGDQASCSQLKTALAASDPLASNTDCSPSNIQNAAANGGYNLTDSQAATLSCIAVPESACGRNTSVATTPDGKVTSATGMFQIVFGAGNDQCHNLNIPVCNDAAAAAGYGITGNLNCSAHFRGGLPIDDVGQACKAAASNISCNASAAACLVQARGGKFNDWTSDSRSSAQQQCINKYAN